MSKLNYSKSWGHIIKPSVLNKYSIATVLRFVSKNLSTVEDAAMLVILYFFGSSSAINHAQSGLDQHARFLVSAYIENITRLSSFKIYESQSAYKTHRHKPESKSESLNSRHDSD